MGDYAAVENNSVQVTEEVRLYMITVIIELHRLKAYKEETLYLACSIAERYLAMLTLLEQPSPCLIRLAFVATLMAAKLEEPIQPSFKRMVRLVHKEWNFVTTKEELVDLETSIIRLLDFDLLVPSPLFFMDRYQRIFGLEQERSDPNALRVANVARKMIRCMLLSQSFLRFRPSVIAASALLLSIGINMSPCAKLMGAA